MPDYREKCLSEKGDKCVVCGATDSIQVHHVDGDRSNNSIENLEPFCNSCHSSVHAGAEGFEEWSNKLLPKHERKRTVTVTLSGNLSRQLEVVRETCPADSDSEAVKFAIKERAETVDGLQDVLSRVDELRAAPTEPDASVIERALEYRVRQKRRVEKLLRRAEEEGSVTVEEVAEVLDTDELRVDASVEWSVGEE